MVGEFDGKSLGLYPSAEKLASSQNNPSFGGCHSRDFQDFFYLDFKSISVDEREELLANLVHAVPFYASTDKDHQQFQVGKGLCPLFDKPFARSLVGWYIFDVFHNR